MSRPLSLVADPAADADIESAFNWYETERPGLGLELLDELRDTYRRILAGPRHYQVLRSGVRRALLRRFPYGVFVSCENDLVVILAVLNSSRDPEEWQRQIADR